MNSYFIPQAETVADPYTNTNYVYEIQLSLWEIITTGLKSKIFQDPWYCGLIDCHFDQTARQRSDLRHLSTAKKA